MNMNVTAGFSLISNISLFFMLLYFLFKIKPIKAAMVYHNKTQAEFIAAIGLTAVFSILNILRNWKRISEKYWKKNYF